MYWKRVSPQRAAEPREAMADLIQRRETILNWRYREGLDDRYQNRGGWVSSLRRTIDRRYLDCGQQAVYDSTRNADFRELCARSNISYQGSVYRGRRRRVAGP